MGNSFLVLVVAIVLLYLAVTDKLSRLLDAWDVVAGNATIKPNAANAVATALTGSPVGSANSSLGAGGGVNMMLPTLPSLGTLHA